METKDVPVISMEVASFLHSKWEMGFHGGVVVGNPLPEEFEMDGDAIEEVIVRAVKQAELDGISGEENTPYLLRHVSEYTEGKSLATNVEIVRNNVRVAALLAKAYCENK